MMTGAAFRTGNDYHHIYFTLAFSSCFHKDSCYYVICVLLLAPPVCCHIFVVGGLGTSMTRIAMLAEMFILLLLGPPKPDRLKDRGQTK